MTVWCGGEVKSGPNAFYRFGPGCKRRLHPQIAIVQLRARWVAGSVRQAKKHRTARAHQKDMAHLEWMRCLSYPVPI